MPLAGAWERRTHEALLDFFESLPDGQQDYRSAVRDLACSIYAKSADPGARYFVDKSPPYFLISKELFATFPAAKFLFLWRSPLSTVASIVETLGGGRWDPRQFGTTLFDGQAALIDAFLEHRERVHAVRFEDLVVGDEEVWRSMFAYLDLEWDERVLSGFADVRLQGRLGDPTGVKRYQRFSTEPLTKWHTTFRSPARKWWGRRYVQWLGRERLASMGYDHDTLLGELAETPTDNSTLIEDATLLLRSAVIEILRPRLLGPGPASTWRAILQPAE